MKIHLHGALKQLSQDPIPCRSNRWDLIYRGLESQLPEFRQKFKESDEYLFVSNGKTLTSDDLQFPLIADELHIIPKIEGSGVEVALILAGYYSAWTVAATIVTNIAISMAVSYVVMSLSPKPSFGASKGADKKDSYYFNGATNVTEVGSTLPIVYGEFVTGSVVVSVGLETIDIYVPPPPEENRPFNPLNLSP